MDHESDRAASDEEPDQRTDDQSADRSEDADSLLQELVAYLRENRTELREEWARRISEARAAGRDVGRGDLLRGDRGVRQLRRRP